MLSKVDSLKALRAYFRKQCVATLAALFTVLQTTSRMSVRRRLQALGYLSSYTHAGRYYTLAEIPRFDAAGLWQHEGIGFSKAGNLKATVTALIEQSPAGYTHQELEAQLNVRVHNTLLDLVRTKTISREPFRGVFLYLSGDPHRGVEQKARRTQYPAISAEASLPDWLVIAVLAAVVRRHRWQLDPSAIVAQLRDQGMQVTPAQVDRVLTELDLKKPWISAHSGTATVARSAGDDAVAANAVPHGAHTLLST